MIDKLYGFFFGDPDHVRWHVGEAYLPSLEFTLTISPFRWELAARRSAHSAWVVVGPIDAGVMW